MGGCGLQERVYPNCLFPSRWADNCWGGDVVLFDPSKVTKKWQKSAGAAQSVLQYKASVSGTSLVSSSLAA